MVGGYSLEAANGDRFFIHAATPAGRFAGPVTDAAEYAGKDITLAIDHVGIVKSALGYESNVFRNVSMGGTAPLAVHYLMKILGIGSIGRLHFAGASITGTGGK